MVVTHTKEAYEALANEVKALKEEVKRLRNEKKDSGRSIAEVEVQPKTRDRKATRYSLVEIYSETTALRKHKKLLGQEVETDKNLVWRVKWGQRGAGLCSLLALIFYIAQQYIATAVTGALALIFIGMLYYKNISFVIAKRLLREANVIIIVLLALCIWVIDTVRPHHSFSAITGLIYLLVVSAFVFIDAVKVKSRVFVMFIGILFVLVNMNNIYDRTLRDADQGVVLFKYTIQGNKYNFMKRSVKRSVFIQIMLFGMNGVYTIFKDRKQELMIFATGNIYRETGTASKHIDDEKYSEKRKSEKRILSV